MSIETATPAVEASEAPAIDTDVTKGLDASEAEESGSVAPEDDPNESFESWLARQDGQKETKTEESVTKSPKEEPKEKVEAPKKEEPKPSKIKIKDKEYSPEELEKAFTEAETTKAEYTKIYKQAEQLVELLKTDPGQIFDRLEVNPEVIEKWYYNKYLLPPEERQARADQEELHLRRKQDEERQAKEEATRKEQLKEQYRQEWSKRINEALDTAGLPKSDLVVSRMAHHMKQALASGRQNVQPSEVVEQVKQDLIELQKSTITGLPPEKLAETLGEDTLSKLRKLEAEKFKQTKFENKNPPKGKAREIKKKQTKKYSSAYDLLDDL